MTRSRTPFHKLALWFGAMAVFSISAISWIALRNLLWAHADLSRTLTIIAESEELFSRVKDAESAARGLAASGREAFLADYPRIRSDVGDLINRLKRRLRDSEARVLLDDVAALAILRLDLTDRLIATYRRAGLGAARSVMGPAKEVMDRLRVSLQKFQSRERFLLEQRSRRAAARARRVMGTIALGGFLSIVIVAWAVLQIRKQEAAQRELAAELDTFFDLAIDMLAIADFNGYFLRLSPSWTAAIGWSEEELKTKPFIEFVHPEDREKTVQEAARLMAGSAAIGFENRYRHKNGEYRTISWSVATQGRRYFASARDVTAIREAERLRQEALQVKADFINLASHELRAPLTAIKMAVDIVQDRTVGDLNDEQLRFLDSAKRNVDRLVRLINDVLDFQKMDIGRFEFQMRSESAAQLLSEACETFLPVAQSKGLKLECAIPSEPLTVRCDRDRVAQVLANYISNALKFTRHGGITLEATREGDRVRLSVRDTGPGIRPEDQAKLFQSFTQLAAGREAGGTGLGLALAKRIAENHGGRVGIESQPGEGSTFFITLPLERDNV